MTILSCIENYIFKLDLSALRMFSIYPKTWHRKLITYGVFCKRTVFAPVWRMPSSLVYKYYCTMVYSGLHLEKSKLELPELFDVLLGFYTLFWTHLVFYLFGWSPSVVFKFIIILCYILLSFKKLFLLEERGGKTLWNETPPNPPPTALLYILFSDLTTIFSIY